MPESHDPDDRRSPASPRACDYCGAAIDTTEWYPVVTRPGSPYEIYAFCDEECRDAWRED